MQLDLKPSDQRDLNIDLFAEGALSSDHKIVLVNAIRHQLDGRPGLAHKAVGCANDGFSLQGLEEQMPHAQVDNDNRHRDQRTTDGTEQISQVESADFAFDEVASVLEEGNDTIIRLFHVVVLLVAYPTSLGLWALILFELFDGEPTLTVGLQLVAESLSCFVRLQDRVYFSQ